MRTTNHKPWLLLSALLITLTSVLTVTLTEAQSLPRLVAGPILSTIPRSTTPVTIPGNVSVGVSDLGKIGTPVLPVTPVPIWPYINPGAAGQACRPITNFAASNIAANRCNTGLACVNDRCIASGGSNQPCNEPELRTGWTPSGELTASWTPQCNQSNHICAANGTCQPAGGNGELCRPCNGASRTCDQCNRNFACNANGRCATAGIPGYTCQEPELASNGAPLSLCDDLSFCSAHGMCMLLPHLGRFKGDSSCEYGDPDCNRCVNDVEKKFASFGKHGGNNRAYDLNWGKFAPEGINLESVLEQTAAGSTHFQSFVRIPNDPSANDHAWFAASHSSSPHGYLLFMRRDGTNEDLKYIYETKTSKHPGGMQAIGQYLLVAHDKDNGDGPAYFESYDVSAPEAIRRTGFQKLGEKHRAANVGVARLGTGGYLLVSNYSSSDNWYHFYYASDIETLSDLTRLDSGFGGKGVLGAHGAENVSLITECGTNKIYMIESNALGNYSSGDNNWHLDRVDYANNEPTLTEVDSASKGKDPECNARASGTAASGPDGELRVYCHQKTAEDQPVAAAASCVVGILSGNIFGCADEVTKEDQMHYREYIEK